MELCYTLLSDGSSDKALIPILNWLLKTHLNNWAIQPQWADLSRLPKSLISTFEKRIKSSIALYPCELLFIHRDAERDSHETRVNEIRTAVAKVASLGSMPTVCVVPVRMTEAWLLFDIVALRKAASNPNGRITLELPDIRRLEHLPNPKMELRRLLREASDLSSRRLRKFSASDSIHRVSELIDDFSPLRVLPAFIALESEINDVIQKQKWESI